MSRLLRFALIVTLLGGLLPAASVSADEALPPAAPVSADAALPPNCTEIYLDPLNPLTSEVYLICLPLNPPPYDVVVFAHGYVPPGAPMTTYYEQLMLSAPDPSDPSAPPIKLFLPDLANGLGYAFISTSYRTNGLAVKEGLEDTQRLIEWFTKESSWAGSAKNVYLIGVSEGGLITTLAAEKGAPIVGGLALCGPIGNFRSQVNYWGDFRVLFDYYYKNVLPPSPVLIPPEVMLNWNTVYTPTIIISMTNPLNQHATEQLLRTSRAPIDPANPGTTAIATTIGILSYNVFATNDARSPEKLGGQPFDNKYKWYFGSDNDWALNGRGGVRRFDADLAALMQISRYYQTSGKLRVPLVTMHTLGDPIVPYWHETLYNAKALFGGSALRHLNIPINRYGHCTFTPQEAVAGFTLLVRMVTGEAPAGIDEVLPTPKLQQDYAKLIQEFQSLPVDPR